MSVSHEEERRIQEIRGSYVLYLPKEWCKAHGIEKGSRVLIRRVGSKLIIEPSDAPRLKTYSDIDMDSYDPISLKHLLIALYVSGAEQIKLTSKKPLSRDTKRQIMSILKLMPGFSIFDEGKNFTVLREVRRGSGLETIVRRVINNARSLFELTISSYSEQNGFAEELEDLDNEIDAIRREAERIFNIMLSNPEIDRDPKYLQRSYVMVQVVRLIERISDHLVAIARLGNSVGDGDRVKIYLVLRDMYKYYVLLDEILRTGIQDSDRRQNGKVDRLETLMPSLVDLIESKEKIHEKISGLGLTRDISAYHITRIYDYITDIAEYLLDMVAMSSFVNYM
ncbi:MAG TPA: PhoU domain-containing protein [Sulfolobales archaeon]|nr:PhoU domain-containing protein [Sulfolobales archaeon]